MVVSFEFIEGQHHVKLFDVDPSIAAWSGICVGDCHGAYMQTPRSSERPLTNVHFVETFTQLFKQIILDLRLVVTRPQVF